MKRERQKVMLKRPALEVPRSPSHTSIPNNSKYGYPNHTEMQNLTARDPHLQEPQVCDTSTTQITAAGSVKLNSEMALPDSQISSCGASIFREKNASISIQKLLQHYSNLSNGDSLLPDTQRPSSYSSSSNNFRTPDVELPETPNITIDVTPSLSGSTSGLDHQLSDGLAHLQDLKDPIPGSFNPNSTRSDTQSDSLNLEFSCKELRTNSDSQLPATRVGTPNPPGSPAASFQASFLTVPPDDSVLYTQPSTAQTSQVPLIRESSYWADLKSLASDSFSVKSPLNKLSCRERKRIVVSSNRPPSLTKAMNQWVIKTQHLLDPFREDSDCWFHPTPPAGRPNAAGILRPCGRIQKTFTWHDRNGKHSIVLNYGIVHKLVNYKMNKQQKDGFINKQWHLSHLCGNWTCLNPGHTTVEPGSINIKRNNCFSHRSGCPHDPECKKEKKVPLGPDGKLIDHNASITNDAKARAVVAWDEWSIQSFNDGEESMFMDYAEDSDSMAAYADEDEDELQTIAEN
jgi:hypothetical protein